MIEPRVRIYISFFSFFRFFWSLIVPSDKSNLTECQAAISKMTGRQFCLLTHSAKTAIYLMLKHGLPPKSKVAVTSFTLSDVINMIFCAGHEPLFVDVNKNNGSLDEEKFFELAKKTKIDAILVTHFFGTIQTSPQLVEFCKVEGIQIFEDAAQVFGGRSQVGAAGSIGLASVFSFGKLKPTSGIRGGCVLTNDQRLHRSMELEQLSWPSEQGVSAAKEAISPLIIKIITLPFIFSVFTFWVFRYAVTRNLDLIIDLLRIEREPQKYTLLPRRFAVRPHSAFFAVLRRELPKYSDDILSRGRVAAWYVEDISNSKTVALYDLKPGKDVLYVLAASVSEPLDLRTFLYRQNKEISVCYHKNCAALECFAEHFTPAPNAAIIEKSTIYLPCNPNMTRREVADITSSVEGYYQN